MKALPPWEMRQLATGSGPSGDVNAVFIAAVTDFI
jgi:hypothetical protein